MYILISPHGKLFSLEVESEKDVAIAKETSKK